MVLVLMVPKFESLARRGDDSLSLENSALLMKLVNRQRVRVVFDEIAY
jgi:hypothetical protein